jgi:hypothetical protein
VLHMAAAMAMTMALTAQAPTPSAAKDWAY